MKIYGKTEVVFGMLGIGILILSYFDIIASDWEWWKLAICLIVSVVFLCQGFSETQMERKTIVNANFQEVGTLMYGRFYAIKLYSPWIVSGIFLSIAFVLTYVVDIWVPDWLVVIYVASLIISTFYMIGMTSNIKKEIEATILKESDSETEK